MSGYNPPFNVDPLPSGASVEDPFIDQLQYFGHKAIDNAGEITELVGDGLSNAAGKALDFISDALDLIG